MSAISDDPKRYLGGSNKNCICIESLTEVQPLHILSGTLYALNTGDVPQQYCLRNLQIIILVRYLWMFLHRQRATIQEKHAHGNGVLKYHPGCWVPIQGKTTICCTDPIWTCAYNKWKSAKYLVVFPEDLEFSGLILGSRSHFYLFIFIQVQHSCVLYEPQDLMYWVRVTFKRPIHILTEKD